MREQSEMEKLNRILKKFWEIEDVSSKQDLSIVQLDEQVALKKVEQSVIYEKQMYRVRWLTNEPAFK